METLPQSPIRTAAESGDFAVDRPRSPVRSITTRTGSVNRPHTSAQAGPSTSAQAGPSTSAPAGPPTSSQAGPSTSSQAGPSMSSQAGPSTSSQAGPSTPPHVMDGPWAMLVREIRKSGDLVAREIGQAAETVVKAYEAQDDNANAMNRVVDAATLFSGIARKR
jgi:hypothetical protein